MFHSYKPPPDCQPPLHRQNVAREQAAGRGSSCPTRKHGPAAGALRRRRSWPSSSSLFSGGVDGGVLVPPVHCRHVRRALWGDVLVEGEQVLLCREPKWGGVVRGGERTSTARRGTGATCAGGQHKIVARPLALLGRVDVAPCPARHKGTFQLTLVLLHAIKVAHLWYVLPRCRSPARRTLSTTWRHSYLSPHRRPYKRRCAHQPAHLELLHGGGPDDGAGHKPPVGRGVGDVGRSAQQVPRLASTRHGCSPCLLACAAHQHDACPGPPRSAAATAPPPPSPLPPPPSHTRRLAPVAPHPVALCHLPQLPAPTWSGTTPAPAPRGSCRA